MRISPEFKREFFKALKLSALITVIALGALSLGLHHLFGNSGARSIASEAASANADGISETSPRRAVPPFERTGP